ncbi:MAG TPA: apolipoprotein N-acyltransferase [Casimicrobiaceae bacterium]|nr:apolipoprotein N-acyltransferase [Casimicrobiaceae bacterium]
MSADETSREASHASSEGRASATGHGRVSILAGALAFVLATAAGAASVFAFAPFRFPNLVFITFAALAFLWLHAASPRAAARQGFAFGLGLFGAGSSWLTVALVNFGGMDAWLAGLAIAILTAYLALWPALAGYVAIRFTAQGSWPRMLAAAGAFTLTEWIRSYLFTGFPWLALGYTQVPDGLVRGYAPLGGVYLVTLVVALVGGSIALFADALARPARRRVFASAACAVVLAAGAIALAGVEWTRTADAPLPVSLVQGNVLQELKFDPKFRDETFERYLDLVSRSRGRLIVLPESAFPMFSDEIPDAVLLSLIRTAIARDGDVLVGLFTALPPEAGSDEPRYYNTVVALGTSPLQFYRKNHLVPFGETIPLKPLVGWFIRSVLSIPLADQARGGAAQPALSVAGERVAVDICYEDAFGAELRYGARDASLLVNVTNDAWYGHSIAAEQHEQIAAMRALELGRPMLRATNTGITSAIGVDGREIARLPWFTTGVLEVTIAGRSGETPYLRIGDVGVLAACAALIAAGLVTARRR